MFLAERVAQIAAEFSRREGGSINVLKLVKLIYLSDRLSMEWYGVPITFDRLVSMDHGPVPSRTLNLINGHDSDAWDKWMTSRANHKVSVRKRHFGREDLDELSEADMEIISEVWKRFGAMSQWNLSDYTHRNCAEWKNPDGSSLPIHERQIFLALGWKREDAVAAQRTIEEQRNLDQVFLRDSSSCVRAGVS